MPSHILPSWHLSDYHHLKTEYEGEILKDRNNLITFDKVNIHFTVSEESGIAMNYLPAGISRSAENRSLPEIRTYSELLNEKPSRDTNPIFLIFKAPIS